MSTVKEITALRRQGMLEEAFRLAKNMMEMEPGEWANMSMFWVLRDMALRCIDNATDSSRAYARECLKRMEALQPVMKDDSDAGVVAIAKIRQALEPHYEELMQNVELSKSNPVQAYRQTVAIVGKQAENLEEELHETFGWILYRYFKAQLDDFTSVEARGLLRDYLVLKNERPSMLHSMMLSVALAFAKNHSDFVFPNFLELWGMSNFRDEDLSDGYNNGNVIPSLISRVCAQLVIAGTPMVEEISNGIFRQQSTVADMHRKQYFWMLFELQKSEQMNDFWKKIEIYADEYGTYCATKWHSDILRLALRKADAMFAGAFLKLMVGCKNADFCSDDWLSEISKEGNRFPPMAVQFAKKCFEFVKAQSEFRDDGELLDALVHIYDQIEAHGVGDEWTARQRAILSVWKGDMQDATERYRKLLRELGDKFYIWQEMAQCVEDASLRVGFLFRALELEKTEDLIGPLRLQTAEALLEIGKPAEARKLIDAYASHRQKQGKPCANAWQTLDDKIKSLGADNGPFDVKKAVLDAMDYAYSDYPWQEFVLVSRFMVNNKSRVVFTNGECSFAVSPKRFDISKQVELGTVVKVRCLTEGEKVMPLMLQITDAPRWGVLPEEFGYVVYVNSSNHAVSVVTSRSENAFFFDKRRYFKVGDFVSFRRYSRKREDGIVKEIVNPQKCRKEEVIGNFKQSIVVVDNVNTQKLLFHIVMRERMVGDIVRFKDTELRPRIGDFLKLTYCLREDKHGKMHIVIFDLQPTDETDDKLVKEVNGWLKVMSKYGDDSADFGFVNDIYVARHILQKFQINTDCRVRGRAVIGADGKWSIFELERMADVDEAILI